jgi:AbrB family looped-hinge helix DNA binding protein
MAKVTSKLQVTIPKALAERSGIRPGDEIDWSATKEGLRIVPSRSRGRLTLEQRLELFDQSTERQKRRQRSRGVPPVTSAGRGWTREDLYRRGRSR